MHIYNSNLKYHTSIKRLWFSGKIHRCHVLSDQQLRWAPGSIPGERINFCVSPFDNHLESIDDRDILIELECWKRKKRIFERLIVFSLYRFLPFQERQFWSMTTTPVSR